MPAGSEPVPDFLQVEVAQMVLHGQGQPAGLIHPHNLPLENLSVGLVGVFLLKPVQHS